MRPAGKWLVAALALGLSALSAAAGEDDPFQAAAKYEAGQSRKALNAVDVLVRASLADAAKRKEAEQKLLALLRADQATLHCKWFVCRQLALVGSAEAVPVLAGHLAEGDQQLGYMARYALEQIPDPAACAALRDALGKAQGRTLAGLATSLGVRRDAEAVPALAKLTSHADAEVAASAAAALGAIGGAEAVQALHAARKSQVAAVRAAAEDGLLGCAARLLADGKKDEALALYADLQQTGGTKHVKLGGFAGGVTAEGAKALPRVLDALGSQDAQLRGTALRLAEALPGTEVTQGIAGRLAGAAPDLAVRLLEVLATRADKAAAQAVLAAAESQEARVRVAALTALGSVGDAATVKRLAAVAAANQGDASNAARNSLARLRGEDVDAALLAAMEGADAAVRAELIRTLAARGTVAAVPALLKSAREDGDERLRGEALRALEVLASPKLVPDLVALLGGAKTDGERAAAEKAVLAVLGRMDDRQPAAPPVLAALADKNTPVPARCSLLRVAGRLGGAQALGAVREGVKDADPAVRNTAVRTLVDWDTAEAMGDLLALAKTAEDKTHKVLALRGFLRMTTLPHPRTAEQSQKLYADALAIATEPQERKTILAELGTLQNPDALQMALTQLADPAVADEAAAAVISISKLLFSSHNKEAVEALKKVAEAAKGREAGKVAEDALRMAALGSNIAAQGLASSPDDLDKDGGAGEDQAAIDGDKGTYWDEVDGRPLYRFVVTFPQPRRFSALSIVGYEHHSYAPKDFDILADGKVVRSVKGAEYAQNFLVVSFPEITAKVLELKITGYYGNSPAIRELGIYEPPAQK